MATFEPPKHGSAIRTDRSVSGEQVVLVRVRLVARAGIGACERTPSPLR